MLVLLLAAPGVPDCHEDWAQIWARDWRPTHASRTCWYRGRRGEGVQGRHCGRYAGLRANQLAGENRTRTLWRINNQDILIRKCCHLGSEMERYLLILQQMRDKWRDRRRGLTGRQSRDWLIVRMEERAGASSPSRGCPTQVCSWPHSSKTTRQSLKVCAVSAANWWFKIKL